MSTKNIPTSDSKHVARPPFPKEDLTPPGIEQEMKTKPQFLHQQYKGSEKLKDKVALITGGDSGIGRSVALHFAMEGAKVAFTYMEQEQKDAEHTLQLLEKISKGHFAISGDVSSPSGCEQIIHAFLRKHDHLDILVNNAACQEHLDKLEDLSFEHFRHTFEVNLFGYFNMIKAVAQRMPKGSCIINTGSVLGETGEPRLIDYAATKGAIKNLTKSLASALSDRSIRVNCVAPGPVWTPLNPAERNHSEIKKFGEETLFKRPAQPFEIAPAYVYLASEITASYITGETINIFGSVN